MITTFTLSKLHHPVNPGHRTAALHFAGILPLQSHLAALALLRHPKLSRHLAWLPPTKRNSQHPTP